MPQAFDCEYCGKRFKKPHGVWFICIECHKENPDADENVSYKERLRDKVELE